MTQIREWDQECHRCHGTGVYQGIGEGDGAGVVCTTCDGTGQEHVKHQFTEFTGRKIDPEVRRVYRTGAGIKLHPELVPGGVSYQEWLKDPDSVNTRGNEIREHACPAQWFRTLDSTWTRGPHWPECTKIPDYPACPSFDQKDKCWERWDLEAENGLT